MEELKKNEELSATLTLTKVARLIGVTKKTLYNMIEDGRFSVEPIKGTHPRRWAIEEIEKWRLNNR